MRDYELELIGQVNRLLDRAHGTLLNLATEIATGEQAEELKRLTFRLLEIHYDLAHLARRDVKSEN